MASETSYSIWEPEVPQIIPERSRLYSLNPIGIGTPQVESLTGYIARLAEAHVLSVGDLVGRYHALHAPDFKGERPSFRRTVPRATPFTQRRI